MTSSDKFCLRWNDFEKNIGVAFRDIREEEDFFDCTLSVGAKHIQAHKLILSACSPFFKSILKQNLHQHPLLYLKGITFNDLQSVLNFMYHGDVSVAQEELNSFLSVAEDLQVKGLTQNSSTSQTSSDAPRESSLVSKGSRHPSKQTLPPASPPPPPRLPSQPPPSSDYQLDEIQEVLPIVKTEPNTATFIDPFMQNSMGGVRDGDNMSSIMREEGNVDNNTREVASLESHTYGEDDYGYGYAEYEGQGYDTSDLGTGINENIVKTPDGLGFTCGLCGKGFGANKHHCRRHIKNFHNLAFSILTCDLCKKTYKNNDSFKNHLRLTHGVYKK